MSVRTYMFGSRFAAFLVILCALQVAPVLSQSLSQETQRTNTHFTEIGCDSARNRYILRFQNGFMQTMTLTVLLESEGLQDNSFTEVVPAFSEVGPFEIAPGTGVIANRLSHLKLLGEDPFTSNTEVFLFDEEVQSCGVVEDGRDQLSSDDDEDCNHCDAADYFFWSKYVYRNYNFLRNYTLWFVAMIVAVIFFSLIGFLIGLIQWQQSEKTISEAGYTAVDNWVNITQQVSMVEANLKRSNPDTVARVTHVFGGSQFGGDGQQHQEDPAGAAVNFPPTVVVEQRSIPMRRRNTSATQDQSIPSDIGIALGYTATS